MNPETDQLDETDATAAVTGADATRYFKEKEKLGEAVSQERVSTVAGAVLSAVHDVIREHDVTYAEYDALKAWLIQVGEDGEWPLFLDVFVEHVVEQTVNKERDGTKGSIEGPFYVPNSPNLGAEGTLPMRDDEPGTALDFVGVVQSVDGTPLSGAMVELWHADDLGFYSQFAPALPEWNLRGGFTTSDDGRFAAHTVQPAPYQIPHDGATGALIAAAGWHAWRPAHLHLKVAAEGHQTITTQLYFEGGEYLDSDIASATKPELILSPTPKADGSGVEVGYDFELARD